MYNRFKITPKNLAAFSLLFVLSACNHQENNLLTAEPIVTTVENIAVDNSIEPHPEVEQIIAPYKEKLDAEMSRVINYSVEAMPKSRSDEESKLGNLIADLTFLAIDSLLQKATGKNVNGIILNFGGLRTSLPQGPITTGKVFEIMPFDNELYAVKLNAQGASALANYLNKKPQPIAGFRFTASSKKIDWLGAQPDADGSIWIGTSSYLAGGGDNMNFFKDHGTEIINLQLLLRDAIAGNFEKLALKEEPIQSNIDGRIAQ
ncbi:MAG: 5'-nucleotidase C-terminal domain-containing protein [Luteibaculaceae bacterium]